MRSIFIRGLLAASVLFVAACSSTDSTAPLSAARRTASAGVVTDGKTTTSIDQYIWVSCANGGAGEAVHVTGEMHYEVNRMQDASGTYHFNFKSVTANLTAVGLTSGTVSRGLMTEHITGRAEDYLNDDNRGADMVRFVTPGSGASYSLMVTSHIIVDQGNYVLWQESWKEVCR